jgi:hypothetical protein
VAVTAFAGRPRLAPVAVPAELAAGDGEVEPEAEAA